MNADTHVKEGERLKQALNKDFSDVVDSIKEILRKYNLDLTPGLAIDVFSYTLEELHLEKFTCPKLIS